MTIAEHLLAIAEELEKMRRKSRRRLLGGSVARLLDELRIGGVVNSSTKDDIAAFRRAAALAKKDPTNG